jgi:hypothetical protein
VEKIVENKIGGLMSHILYTGTPPLTRFFGPGKNRFKGKQRYRRSIIVYQNPKTGNMKA